MRLLVPDGKVKEVAEALDLSPSLIYQERRPFGKSLTKTGTRNAIARLDIITELALSHTPQAVRLLGQRYQNIYTASQVFNVPEQKATREELLKALSQTQLAVGEVISAMINEADADDCAMRVEHATLTMQRALKIVETMNEVSNES
jgi:hypothetical protein